MKFKRKKSLSSLLILNIKTQRTKATAESVWMPLPVSFNDRFPSFRGGFLFAAHCLSSLGFSVSSSHSAAPTDPEALPAHAALQVPCSF